MMSSRLPRFERDLSVSPFEVTERDCAIIGLVHEHRFLRSSEVISLLGGSPQQILRRLKLLYHHGYLERPRCQLNYYHKGGSREIVYGLGKNAASFLAKECAYPSRKLLWDIKSASIGRVFLEHALMVSEIMVKLELDCREKGIRFVREQELATAEWRGKERQLFRWRTSVNGRKLGIAPDRVFALESTNENGERNRAYFFLEADRGTMPVMRSNPSQTSFHRKILGYEATWSEGGHTKRFGFNRFRVLTVTTNAERVRSLVKACSSLERGHGLFLFTDLTSFREEVDIFALRLWSGRQDVSTQLLN